MMIIIALLFICFGMLLVGTCFTTPITGNPIDGLVCVGIGGFLLLLKLAMYIF